MKRRLDRTAKPTLSISLLAHGLDLDSTLASGQSFSWLRAVDGSWRGWIGGRPCRVWREGEVLHAAGPAVSAEQVERYFGLDLPFSEILASFPDDPWLDHARAFAPGLRVLRQEPWETLCNFICSSLKQIVQIEQINRDLRRTFGERLSEDLYTFPHCTELARVSEAQLRGCRLGFRARHLYVAAGQIAAGQISLEALEQLATDEARTQLRLVRGVGEKVANCVLLFAYGRAEAFPIDVWVERVLRRLYFEDDPKISLAELRAFADLHFGPFRGHAQQFLFHWIRKDRTALPPPPTRKLSAVRRVSTGRVKILQR